MQDDTPVVAPNAPTKCAAAAAPLLPPHDDEDMLMALLKGLPSPNPSSAGCCVSSLSGPVGGGGFAIARAVVDASHEDASTAPTAKVIAMGDSSSADFFAELERRYEGIHPSAPTCERALASDGYPVAKPVALAAPPPQQQQQQRQEQRPRTTHQQQQPRVTFRLTPDIIQMPSAFQDRFVTTLGTCGGEGGGGSGNPKQHTSRPSSGGRQRPPGPPTHTANNNNTQPAPTPSKRLGDRRQVIASLERIIKELVLDARDAAQAAAAHAAAAKPTHSAEGETSGPSSHAHASPVPLPAPEPAPSLMHRYGGHNFKGVTKHRCTGRWEAHIWDEGKQVYLGGFGAAISAARAYDIVAIKTKSSKGLSDGMLNFPLEDYHRHMQALCRASKDEMIGALRRKSCGFARGLSKYRGVTRRSQNGRWEARSASVGSRKYTYVSA